MVVARVEVHLKKGVADPEGENTLKALKLLGFKSCENVKSVKLFEISLDEDETAARASAEEMCQRLLANPVIHDYRIEIVGE
jgi:phosphoribosylformylglycinamidine synthase